MDEEEEEAEIRRRRAAVIIEVETLHITHLAEVDVDAEDEVAEEAAAVEKSIHPRGLRRRCRIMLKINSTLCLEDQPKKKRNKNRKTT